MLSPNLRRRLDALEQGYSSPRLVALAMSALDGPAGVATPTPGPAAELARDFAAALHAIATVPGMFPMRPEDFPAKVGGGKK